MEVTDNPPDAVNESTVTLGLQSSPSMVDAATQTDVNQSDAAVQWPADVDYPVKKDHSYTGKHEIEMGKRVQEDDIDNSQDLFLSNDELGEQSQPQCSHFDPEYIVSSSEFSQSTQESQASTNTHKEMRVFLVFEEQLNQLLQRCLKCGSLIVQEEVKELKIEGSQLTLEITCANNCSYRWQSQPTLSGTKGTGNLLLTASVFFSGIRFAKFEHFCSNMNLKTISEDTYTSLRKKFVFPVIQKTWIKEQSTVLSTMKSQEVVVLCGDGRCDSPGHSAKYCTYTFLDAQSQKVVDFKAVFQDGESVGEPKFKISWSKVHKTFRARPVPVEKDYSYMTAMTADVLSSVLDSKQVMDMRINPTHVMAPQERLSRSQIIFKHSSFHVSSSCIITNT
ncbi:uncharacterized protein LOC127636023 isoform X1 [Xyrauchen texanus]|uniref:uncharacterized protein LOC127636023 isoform X1 n=1 Tax=Xyrauchen texanus TaxID=154827 RepID=UPI00224280AE|nr:uncharacterized protein LOC127636023 isoform X1 [Xyrauchen texanus]